MSYLLIIFLAVAGLLSYLFYFQRKTPYGMLDFKAALMLHVLPKDQDIKIDKARALYDKLTERKNKQDKLVVELIKDLKIPYEDGSIDCRLYDHKPDEAKPIIIFAHGGGWCIGNIETHDRTCKKIALATGYKILSVEYSLAPEHPLPQAVNEISEVTKYVSKNQDQFNISDNEIMIMGDSAGGNLAFTTTLNLIEQGESLIKRIIAIYPIIDPSFTDTSSYNNFEKGFFLTRRMMRTFIDFYIPDEAERKNYLASPKYYSDITKLPPVYLITAQFDPLRDEGEAFAAQLKGAGVSCTSRRYDGVIHGFFANPMFGHKGDGAVEDVATYLHEQQAVLNS